MCYNTRARGCSSMAERQLPKLNTRVRFPSPAPASSRTSYRSRRRFFVPNKRHLSLTSSLLLSKLNPLRWASIWVFFCKVRSTSFPATACGYCRKLRSLPCASFQIRSTLASDLFFLLRATYRSRRRFFVPNKRHLSLTSSLLLSKLNPLRWASIRGHTAAKVKLRSRLASEFFIRRGRFGLRSSTGGFRIR